MIKFNRVKWKNFLSTGNSFTEIDLSKNKSTLVVGPNGCGKSTMLDAISFGLFGKPHRNISKNQLINSLSSQNYTSTNKELSKFEKNKNFSKIAK